ncbi:hypothetical protein [Amycolatopsis sp. NPDC004079]|uniref:phosphotransferase-like protein n=1 Tax=Amycolatopsis sp. NPDC004079 TaxID=3154549 RepID=UPI0033B052DE
MSGHVVFLNGTSSSGKSSIATELLELLPGTYFSVSRGSVHARCDYDLECETSVHSSRECAQIIADFPG